MKIRSVATGFALFAIFAGTALPAQSQNIFGQMFGSNSGGYARNSTQQAMLNNFNNRQAQLRAQIDASVRSRALSPGQAQQFIAQLDQVGAMTQSYFSGRGPNARQSQQITNSLEGVATQINAAVASNPITPNPYNGYYNRRPHDQRYNGYQGHF